MNDESYNVLVDTLIDHLIEASENCGKEQYITYCPNRNTILECEDDVAKCKAKLIKLIGTNA